MTPASDNQEKREIPSGGDLFTLAKRDPLPGLLAWGFIPYLEGARTVSRFILVAFLGVLGLSIGFLDRLPRGVALLLIGIWIIELAPPPNLGFHFDPSAVHPAHAWLRDQPPDPTRPGIVDIEFGRIKHGGELLYTTTHTGRPTVSSIGSFFTQSHVRFQSELDGWKDQSSSSLHELFLEYETEYVIFHDSDRHPDSAAIAQLLLSDPERFRDIGCFDPPEGYRSPWGYRMCLVQILD